MAEQVVVPLPKIPEDEREVCLSLLGLFQIDGEPANELITEGQLATFWALVFRPNDRVQILTSTQYGKSLIVALACIIISCVQDEVVSVIAPTNNKARIIMRYYVEHIGDNIMFYSQLDKETRLDRLRQEESKERIILRRGGGIFAVSVQAGNTKKTVEAAMGLGSKIVIQDESCLIPDETEATVFRMIAGKGKDAFYCKIGNPFYRTSPYTHFWDSWHNEDYLRIFIDYKRALEEGRYTKKFINEAMLKPHFDILFECKFPEEDIMDTEGWIPLLTHKEIEIAMDGSKDIDYFGEKFFGGDPADSGQDEAAVVVRAANLAKVEFASAGVDLMQFVGQSLVIIKDHKIKSNCRFGDSIGLGAGYIGRIREQGQSITGVNVAEKALDQKNFVNKKAEAFWATRKWIKDGGKLSPDERWYQLTEIKYRAKESDGRMEIMSKQKMRMLGFASPDVGEALMLTFGKPVRIFEPSYEDKHFADKMRTKKLRKKILGYKKQHGKEIF